MANNAPAPMAPAVDVEALTAAPARRTQTYRVPDGATRAEFGDQWLTRGTHGKSGAPSLVLVNGTNQTGFPYSAVLIAIMEGIVPRAEIEALLAASDARKAAASQ